MTYGGRPGAYWELNGSPLETACILSDATSGVGINCMLTWDGSGSTVFKAGTNTLQFHGGRDTCSEGYVIYYLKAFDKVR